MVGVREQPKGKNMEPTTSTRDELTEILWAARKPWTTNTERRDMHAGQAEAIIAAGYRKPRTITTAEEVDALPVGSVVMDVDGFPSRKFAGGWRTMVAEPDGSAWLSGHMEDPEFPATVSWEPSA